MLPEWMPQLVAFIGCLAGTSYRTYIPYADKVKEMEANGEDPIKFLNKYKFTGLLSFITTAAVSVGLFSGLHVDSSQGLGAVFVITLTSAMGLNSLVNRSSFQSAASNIVKKIGQKEQKAESESKSKPA